MAKSLEPPEPPPRSSPKPLPPPLPKSTAGAKSVEAAPGPPKLPPGLTDTICDVAADTSEHPKPSTGPPRQTGFSLFDPFAAPVRVDVAEVSIEEETLNSKANGGVAKTAIRKSPPWVVSMIVHAALLTMLAMAVVITRSRRDVELVVTVNPTNEESEPLLFDDWLGADEEALDEKLTITPENLPPVNDPLAPPPIALIHPAPEGNQATSDSKSVVSGFALGRQEGMKKKLLGMYKGTGKTEKAVENGLKWLARFQLDAKLRGQLNASNPLADPDRDGSWSLCGPFTNGAREGMDNPAAATAMALLAFQGAGNTPGKGPFGRNVKHGWEWLLKQQGKDGNFFHEGFRGQRYYTEGQCAIALCELYAMTKDPKYKEPAERSVKYLLDGQSRLGGWKYEPQGSSDVSVTGWIVMALQSAKRAGLEVPPETFDKVHHFLDVIALEGGSRYPYERNKDASPAMTAEALLIRQYLGWEQDDSRLLRGADYITSPECLISFQKGRRDVYYWYYAAQVARHMDDEFWDRWNTVMREEVPKHQVQSGRESGSWDPNLPAIDRWGSYGGRLYVTSMSICLLEVYYRHMPLYRRIY